MNEKVTQVSIGLKRPKQCSIGMQTSEEPAKTTEMTDCGNQCGTSKDSYGHDRKHKTWRYDDLIAQFQDKETLIEWLMEEGLLGKKQLCSLCGDKMKLVDRSDGVKWECRKQVDGKSHRVEKSIRKDSWFEQSKWTLEEILKFTYWWCQDLDQNQITHELRFAAHSGVDWDSFCR